MAQYTERFQYNDLLACEYDSLFNCMFETYCPSCDYFYEDNDDTYSVVTIRSTETYSTTVDQDKAFELREYEMIATRLHAAGVASYFVYTYCEEGLPF